MEVLFFQIIIFVIISVSSLFGRKTHKGITIILFVFTLFAVFASWLMMLQLFVIYFSYSLTRRKKIKKLTKEEIDRRARTDPRYRRI